ncbi:MAG: DUF1573 domain-containing protein [candidate division Zixibacteria bacterium]|nr:DUF1573 domain-containing protein [candidate division Zixibacteria bacterium]
MVAVGDSAKIELKYKRVGGRQGYYTTKQATVTTNDASIGNFQLAFKVRGYSEPDSTHPIVLSEKSLTFNEENRSKKVKIKVKNVSDEKLKMRLISVPHGFLDVDISGKRIKPGKTRDIKVKIDKHFEGVNFKKSFTIELNDSLRTRYTIPVVLEKKEVVRAPAKAKTGTRTKQNFPANRGDSDK